MRADLMKTPPAIQILRACGFARPGALLTRGVSAVLMLLFPGLIAPLSAQQASGAPINNKVAVFAALNKITARISTLEVALGKSQKFGALTITPKSCTTQPPTEPPATKSFIEVKERKLNGEQHQLFSGWIFAENPGIHAVEHPVYDVWLTNCKIPVGGVASSKSEKLRQRRTRVRSRRR